jgi:predicted SAM-dependent methyltransferase
MVSDIIQDRIKLTKRQQTVYEAGVGLGYALREIIKIPDIKYYGCDVTLLQDTKRLCDKNENVFVNENTLYDDIQRMGDNSIDVFYADNVIEHLIPDEADEIFKLLHRKMKRKGILVLVIPNRYLGPSDVTKYYLAKGDKAKGFHFMEMSYSEVIRFAKHHGFKANYIYKDNKVMKDFLGFQNMGRTITENYFVNHKNISVREELMSLENFNTYILSR